MLTPLVAYSLRSIITFTRIVFSGAVELRRWDSIKPALVQLQVGYFKFKLSLTSL